MTPEQAIGQLFFGFMFLLAGLVLFRLVVTWLVWLMSGLVMMVVRWFESFRTRSQ